MAKEDFLACLTRELKDEVMERYVTERRLIELQIEALQEQAHEVRRCAREAAKRLERLGYWMIHPPLRQKLFTILKLPDQSPWREHLEKGISYGLRSIALSAFRNRTKLREIILKAYDRLYQYMELYARAVDDLRAECEAVKTNVQGFQNAAELPVVLSFLKGLDRCAAEKSHFLGGNFTAEELVSVEQKLRFRAPSLDSWDIAAPLSLPGVHDIERALIQLADEIFDYHQSEAKRLIALWERKGF